MAQIQWQDDFILGNAVTAATPSTTRDIANSVDATQARLASCVARFTGGSSPAVTVSTWVWSGAAYVATGETYDLDADSPMIELPGGYHWALTGAATGTPSAWSIAVGVGG